MGLPVEVNNLMLGSLGGYTVGRSLRFRSSASAYLNRTPASASNRTTWTWSGWVKRGGLGTTQRLMSSVSSNGSLLGINSSDQIQITTGDGGTAYNFVSSSVYRDPSAWYHIVFVCNTTSATSTQTGTTTDRLQMWVNGIQLSAFATNQVPTQNFAGVINTTNAHYIGSDVGTASYLNGYLAEVNFIDGQALTPSSFGAYDNNGVWQPKKYTGTYGTNGFYLPFSNTTSTTTLVADSSGNGNNWTPNNISLTAGTTYDSMIDSPTVSASSSNYATWNPIFPFGNQTFSNGNLSVATGTTGGAIATISVSSRKWYWEVSPTTIAAGTPRVAGLVQAITAPTSLTSKSIYLQNDGKYSINGAAAVTYGGAITTSDIVGVAVDVDAQTVTFYKNGTAMGSAISISSVYTSGDLIVPAMAQSGGANNAQNINFGQQPFSYTPPTGFKALNTYNLPAPSIANGAQYFAATLYTGNGTGSTVNNNGNFQPDFVWMKNRSVSANHALYDSLRTAMLSSNTTDAEVAGSNIVTYNSNGFSVNGGDSRVNANTNAYVGWQWKAGGTGVTNTSGTITSTVSASPSSGFSIATYTGTGANATVGHGLGVAPNLIFVKRRSGTAVDWLVYSSSVALNGSSWLVLNTTAAATAGSTQFNSTAPTSSVFSVGTDIGTNASAATYVAYCFSAVSGYSAFGKYTGNGSADGTFAYFGFRPRWVMIKRTDTTSAWNIFDTSLNPYNLSTQSLVANTSAAENTGVTIIIDIMSNGIKMRGTDAALNASGGTYIYAAFAESPFNLSRAR